MAGALLVHRAWRGASHFAVAAAVDERESVWQVSVPSRPTQKVVSAAPTRPLPTAAASSEGVPAAVAGGVHSVSPSAAQAAAAERYERGVVSSRRDEFGGGLSEFVTPEVSGERVQDETREGWFTRQVVVREDHDARAELRERRREAGRGHDAQGGQGEEGPREDHCAGCA